MQRKETPCTVIVDCFIVYAKRISDNLSFNKRFGGEKSWNYNYSDWSAFIQIQILLARINMN